MLPLNTIEKLTTNNNTNEIETNFLNFIILNLLPFPPSRMMPNPGLAVIPPQKHYKKRISKK
jgi:hypothetical protein